MRFRVLPALAIPLFAQECATEVSAAREAYSRKDYPLAVRRFERAAIVCPKRPEMLLDLARAQLLARRPEAADRTLEDVLKLEPRNSPALKLKADAQYLLGRAPEAERLLLAAAEADPRSPEPHYALGRIYYQQVKLDRAIERFRKAIALDPAGYRAYDNLGLAYEGLNDVSRALEHYRKALALVHKDHPEYDTVFANVANLLYRQGDFQESFQYAAEAASRNPDSARNFLLTGRALAALERWEQALKWLRRAVELDPSDPGARYQLAQAYRALGRDAEADRELRSLDSPPAPTAPR